METVGAGRKGVLGHPVRRVSASALPKGLGGMRFNGFFQARRGLEEHLYQGRINVHEYAVHRLITSQADPRDGIWFGSAKAVWHCIGARILTERQCRRILEDLTKKGYLKRFVKRRQKGNFPILVDKFLVTQGANAGKYLSAKKSLSWRNAAYEQLLTDSPQGAQIEPTAGEQRATTGILDTRKEKQEKTHTAQASPSLVPIGFDTFWNAYPRKVGKPAALRAWRGLLKVVTGSHTPHSLMTGLERWKQTEQWQNEKFIPYPATFLNQRRWEDEPPAQFVTEGRLGQPPEKPGKCGECGTETAPGFLRCYVCTKKKAPVNP